MIGRDGNAIRAMREQDWRTPVRKTEAIENLETARSIPNAYLVMEGDWGGQIYLTIPVLLVRCSASDIESLLHDLDSTAWSCNSGQGCGAFFEKHDPGEGIPGGMGGGITTQALWLHPELVNAGIEEKVRQILLQNGRT